MYLMALVQILTIIANREAMWKMRAEMSVTPEEKKHAIDEGLKVSDFFQGILQKIIRKIEDLRDDDPKPVTPPPVAVK